MLVKHAMSFLTTGMLFAVPGYAQDAEKVVGEAARIYAGVGEPGNGLIAGFSVPGMIGGILFSCIGFVAFMYGKKNSEFRPMILGILLMGYPYFFKGTLILYVIGALLSTALFFWRE